MLLSATEITFTMAIIPAIMINHGHHEPWGFNEFSVAISPSMICDRKLEHALESLTNVQDGRRDCGDWTRYAGESRDAINDHQYSSMALAEEAFFIHAWGGPKWLVYASGPKTVLVKSTFLTGWGGVGWGGAAITSFNLRRWMLRCQRL